MFRRRKHVTVEYWNHDRGRWEKSVLPVGSGQVFVYRLSRGKDDTIDVVRVRT